VSALILDAGALVGVDRNDPDVVHLLRRAQQEGLELRTNPMVVAQVWRDRQGRQANLARLLQAVKVQPVHDEDGREAGVLLGRAGTADPVDATVALLAGPGDRIFTSDPDDLTKLVDAAGCRAVVVAC
jgi:glycine/D-amino acid oxidase-like deaminating enzyme